nr:acetyl-CoA carboxylase beta subunit [Dichondra micrantha]
MNFERSAHSFKIVYFHTNKRNFMDMEGSGIHLFKKRRWGPMGSIGPIENTSFSEHPGQGPWENPWGDRADSSYSNVDHLCEDSKDFIRRDDRSVVVILVRDSKGDAYFMNFDIEYQRVWIEPFLRSSDYTNLLIAELTGENADNWDNPINRYMERYLQTRIRIDITTYSDSSDCSDSSDYSDSSEDETPNYEHLWLECENCESLSYKRVVKSKMYLCEECGDHLKMGSSDRLKLYMDPGTWEPMDEDLYSSGFDSSGFIRDPLGGDWVTKTKWDGPEDELNYNMGLFQTRSGAYSRNHVLEFLFDQSESLNNWDQCYRSILDYGTEKAHSLAELPLGWEFLCLDAHLAADSEFPWLEPLLELEIGLQRVSEHSSKGNALFKRVLELLRKHGPPALSDEERIEFEALSEGRKAELDSSEERKAELDSSEERKTQLACISEKRREFEAELGYIAYNRQFEAKFKGLVKLLREHPLPHWSDEERSEFEAQFNCCSGDDEFKALFKRFLELLREHPIPGWSDEERSEFEAEFNSYFEQSRKLQTLFKRLSELFRKHGVSDDENEPDSYEDEDEDDSFEDEDEPDSYEDEYEYESYEDEDDLSEYEYDSSEDEDEDDSFEDEDEDDSFEDEYEYESYEDEDDLSEYEYDSSEDEDDSFED